MDKGNVIVGRPGSPSYAVGKLYVYERKKYRPPHVTVEDTSVELKRFDKARQAAIDSLSIAYERTNERAGAQNAEIFKAHTMLLKDEEYNARVINNILTDRMNAEWAVSEAGRYFYELHAIVTDPPADSALAYRPIPVPVEELLKVAESVSKDPVAAADESVLFGFVPEEDGEPVTEGLCPRCGKEALAFVSGEAVRTDPSSPDSPLYTTEEACDDPTHPDGCRVTVTYAWDEWACPNPECRYRVSGSGMHEQTRTHSGE